MLCGQRVEGDAGVLRHLDLDGEVAVGGQAQRAEPAPAEPHDVREGRRRRRTWQRRADQHADAQHEHGTTHRF